MKTQIEKPNSFLWKIYFVTCGVLSLICWNSVLNLIDYTGTKLGFAFGVYITFSFSIGSLLSFVVSPIIFGKLKHRTAALLSLSLTFTTFYFMFIVIKLIDNVSVAQILSAISIFFCGFFGTFFQSKTAGLAASASNAEMVLFNFGTGLSGFSSNIFAFVITKLFLMPDEPTEEIKIQILEKQLYAYLVVVAMFGILFIIIENMYERTHSEYFDTKSEQEIEAPLDSDIVENDKVVAMNSIKIIRRCIDMLFGLLFQYVIVLVIITFFLIRAYNEFDKDSFYTLSFYFFWFNLCDSLGKFVNPSKLIYSPNKLHVLNFLKLLFLIYFIYLLTVQEPIQFLSSGAARCVVLAFMGLVNGYFTNCFIGVSTNRFEKPLEKGKAAYFSIFFLLAGITIGNLLGIFYAPASNVTIE